MEPPRDTASRVVYENRWMRLHEDRTKARDGAPGLYAWIEKPPAAVPEFPLPYWQEFVFRWSFVCSDDAVFRMVCTAAGNCCAAFERFLRKLPRGGFADTDKSLPIATAELRATRSAPVRHDGRVRYGSRCGKG